MWERRWHPLRAEWVTVAAHRNRRPWHGAAAAATAAAPPSHVAGCHLCPRNVRVSGAVNPDYAGIHVFDNDHPCVGPDAPEVPPHPSPLYRRERAAGVARVICYHPRHDLRLSRMPAAAIDGLLACWQDQTAELMRAPGVRHVLIFENNGEAVGVSNPHPHCQVYATGASFPAVSLHARLAAEHRRATGRGLYADIIAAERGDGVRILADNGLAVAFVPWFARWAYEVHAAPTRPVARLDQLDARERRALAEVAKDVLVRYDNLWRMPFPYVAAVQQAGADDGADVHCHLSFLPPLRRPGLLKHLAGPEIGGGGFIADTLPEETAAELRAAGGPHYLGEEAAP